MNYQVMYSSEGNAALKAAIPRHPTESARIIPFPGNTRPAVTRVQQRNRARRQESALQEYVTVEEIPFGVEYIPARHLFYWMTDETSAQLRAQHAPRLSPRQRRLYHLADRVHNAVVNYPFVTQLRYGTPDAFVRPQLTALQTLAVLGGSCLFALVMMILGS